MGKLNHGPNTKAKGKAGAFVYQQYEGMQIFKEYQPNVANPQSPKQVENRAKFKAASSFTSKWWGILQYLRYGSSYERFKRGAALRTVHTAAVYRDNTNIAAIDVTTALEALNENGSTSADVINFTHTGTFPNVTEKASPSAAPTNSIIHALAISWSDEGKMLGVAQTTLAADAAGVTINLPAGVQGVTPNNIQVMAVMLTPTTEAGHAIYGQALSLGSGANDAEFQVSVSRAVVAGDLLVTPIAYDFLTA